MPATRPLENVPGVMHVPKARPRAAGTGLWWPVFGAFVLLTSGFLNITWGILELTKNFYFGDSLTRGDVESWGWIWISYGVVELIVATMVLAENGFGLLAGLVLIVINTALHIPAFGGHHIGWAVVTVSVNALAAYALLTPWLRSRT